MDPNAPPPSLEPDLAGRLGAFFCFTAGIAALFGGGQVWSVVIFRDAWAEWLAIGHALTGVVAIVLAAQVAVPRRWAALAALVVLAGLSCLGVPWAGWLMWHGLFTALSVFAPLWATIALLILGAGTPALLKTAAARRAADAENARLAKEAADAGYGFAHAPRPRHSALVLGALYVIVGAPFATFGLAVAWPDQYARLEARVIGTFAGRNPFGHVFVDHASAYPYSGSPLEWYLDYEGRFVPLDRELVLRMADEIAADVGWRLSAATGEADPVAAEAALWAAGNQKELPLWIAQNLRERGVFYHPESLFSRSFDPEVHGVGKNNVHLDCDQLAYVFAHVAMRLDLAMKVVPSVQHVYLRYDGPSGEAPLYVETTQFRSVDIDGNRIDYAGASIGEDFYVDADYYSSGRSGTWATASITAAAGLYEPSTEEDIRDNIVGNVLVGLEAQGKSVYPDESEAHLAGTRSITLVNNLYRWYILESQSALERGDLATAEARALRARAIRAEHGTLLIRSYAPEEEVLATIDVNRAPPTP